MRKVSSKAVRIGIMRLSYIQSLNQLATTKIIELGYIVILVISSKQDVSFDVEAITRNGRPAYLANWTRCLPDVPHLDCGIPPPTKKQVGVFLKAFDWKHSIDMMVDFQLIRSSSLKYLHRFQSFTIKNLQSIQISAENAPFLFGLIVAAEVRDIVFFVMAISCLLVFVVPFDGAVAVTSYKVVKSFRFPANSCSRISAHSWGIAYL